MSYDIPDYLERKGSLFLRANHMNYSRAILNSNWHQARESEPKDYNISQDPVRDLTIATYNRIGNVTDGSLPETTYQDMSQQVFLKPKFMEQDNVRPMINKETLQHAHIDRDTGDPKEGYTSVLPRHNKDYNKYYLETTHRSDFKAPYPFIPEPEVPADFPDQSAAVRRCHSQFTDTSDFRRPGRNTWADESGIYANTHFKREIFVPRNPIPKSL
ncbi:cilia- and flagella-associated protein 95-like [Littorina saxatilis]|uniref:Uncharacterized protein n=1 Tax=Littorina saxatilis TaxID=31220 RepID=A0AAN9B7U4_9CAEN